MRPERDRALDLHDTKAPGEIWLQLDAPCRVVLDTDASSWFDQATGRRLLAPSDQEVAS